MEFYNTYVNLETGKNVSINEVIEFVEYVAKTFNPNASYNNDITAAAFRNGFGGYIIQTCLDIVRKNPNKFLVQKTNLYSRTGELLNTYFKQL